MPLLLLPLRRFTFELDINLTVKVLVERRKLLEVIALERRNGGMSMMGLAREKGTNPNPTALQVMEGVEELPVEQGPIIVASTPSTAPSPFARYPPSLVHNLPQSKVNRNGHR